MNAYYLNNGHPKFRTDYPYPQPDAGEALVRVTLAGICGTDLEILKGYGGGFTGILGHEFVGVVEKAADPFWVGRRVTSRINLGCGRCAACLNNNREHCPNRTVVGIIGRDGIFADYVALPLVNLVPIPDAVPDEAAVFTEPLAAALRIREQVAVRPTARTAVVGPGRLGLLVAKTLSLAGTEVTVLGRQNASLAIPRRWGLSAGLVEEAADSSFDFVVEATGNTAGLAHSLRIIRPLGTMVLKSTFAGEAAIDLTKVVVDELTVLGSRCGPFEPAVRLLAQGVVPVTDLIAGRYPLSQIEAALARAAQPGALKILLDPAAV